MHNRADIKAVKKESAEKETDDHLSLSAQHETPKGNQIKSV